MKNEGITQGPWVAHVNYATQSGQVDPAHPHWCEVRSDNNAPNGYPLSITGHFGIANARLIAAAPDMLTAMKNAVEFLTQGNAEAHFDESNPEDQDALRQINQHLDAMRAAIAKAEGRA